MIREGQIPASGGAVRQTFAAPNGVFVSGVQPIKIRPIKQPQMKAEPPADIGF